MIAKIYNKVITILVILIVGIIPVTNIYFLQMALQDIRKGFDEWQNFAVIYVYSSVLLIEAILLFYYLSI